MALRSGTLLLAALACSLSSEAVAQESACLADAGPLAGAEGVTFRNGPESAQGYGSLRVEAAHGAHMYIYFDDASEAEARSRAACLGKQLDVLRAVMGDTRSDAEWNSVVFTSDAAYLPPRGDVMTHWVIDTAQSDIELADRVLNLVPHEQVHEFQGRNNTQLPRWISEGHASWVEHQVLAQLDEATAATSRAERIAALENATGPLNLANWGSVRPKPEAILRQISKEDRRRMEDDPDYMPKGTYTFTSDDLEGDESNMPARYAGALLVFEGLAARHGADAVDNWLRELTASGEKLRDEAIAQSIRMHFGEDVETLLSDTQFAVTY